MRARKLSLLTLPCLAACLAVASASSAVAQGQQQWTQEQRAACEDDAMRLCGNYVPDVQRITACMRQMQRYLSPRCRAVFSRHRR
ncbi:MAG: hypothetical protein IT537_00475 [Hyphomicrobiales bacterium]|nr:hypothetical protein [Hyphomicrobiales bacterium]